MPRAKTTRKSTAYLRCSTPKCRRKAKAGSGLCAVCEKASTEAAHPIDDVIRISELQAHPIDGVVRISELQANRFGRLDAEIRNAMLSVRNLELEMAQAKQRYELEQNQRATMRQQHLEASEARKTEYLGLVSAIAKEHGLDPKKMSIDPDSQVVRDLRNE